MRRAEREGILQIVAGVVESPRIQFGFEFPKEVSIGNSIGFIMDQLSWFIRFAHDSLEFSTMVSGRFCSRNYREASSGAWRAGDAIIGTSFVEVCW